MAYSIFNHAQLGRVIERAAKVTKKRGKGVITPSVLPVEKDWYTELGTGVRFAVPEKPKRVSAAYRHRDLDAKVVAAIKQQAQRFCTLFDTYEDDIRLSAKDTRSEWTPRRFLKERLAYLRTCGLIHFVRDEGDMFQDGLWTSSK